MIRFRQKDFFLPAVMPIINTVGSAAMVGGLFQGAKQMKQANEQAQQAEEQNRELTRALNKIAKNAKDNPQVSQQVNDVLSQRQFARLDFSKILKSVKNSKSMKNATGLVKDVGGIINENRNHLIGGVLAGGALGASSYLTDKAIQSDMKRSGIPLQKTYAISGKSILSGIKKSGRILGDAVKNNKKTMLGMAVLGSAPTALGYVAEKNEFKDQMNSTQQKMYSIGRVLNSVKNAQIWKTPGKTILGGISNLSGGGGRKGVENFGKNLYNRGIKSGSKWSQNVGKFIMKNPKTSLGASIPVGLGIMAGTWDTGEKIVRKGAEAIDKNAYAYQKSKEQEIQ